MFKNAFVFPVSSTSVVGEDAKEFLARVNNVVGSVGTWEAGTSLSKML